MYTIQGIIRKGINNSSSQFERLSYVGKNFSNFSTNGYKAVRFEQMLGDDGYVSAYPRTDYSQGDLKITGNPYDVAIKGNGFIPVVSPEGDVAYTRDGSFKIGKEGYLMTNDDWIVGSGIKIPSNIYKFEIKPDGKVVSYDTMQSAPKELGTIPLVEFPCNEGLEAGDGNKLWQTDKSGDPALIKEHNSIAQNYLENSNTNIFNSVNEMLRLNSSMLASMSMLKMANDMYNKGINIREG